MAAITPNEFYASFGTDSEQPTDATKQPVGAIYDSRQTLTGLSESHVATPQSPAHEPRDDRQLQLPLS